ncbi:MAG: CPBP family intramembrane glutamic endopeptidase [Mycobacteriales bacterium]
MSLPWLRPEFSPLGTVLGFTLLAYLIVIEPWLGMRSLARLRRRRGNGSAALSRVYVQTLATETGWLGMVGLILWASPGLHPSALGLRAPAGPLVPLALGFTVAAVLLQLTVGLLLRLRGVSAQAPGDFAYLLPVTSAQRRLAGVVALGASVSEEVVVRGLLIAFGVGVLGAPPLLAVAGTTVLFGAMHAYQGRSGVLFTTVLGAVLAALYLMTGSLLLPILLHVAINTRALLITRYADPAVES